MHGPRIAPKQLGPGEVEELLGGGTTFAARPLNIFGTLAHNPRVLKRFNVLGGGLLAKGRLPAREREIVILRVGWRSGSVYEFGQHTLIGRQAGLTDEEIARLAGAPGGEWSPADAALVAMADELCATDDVGDATWAALAERWDEAELVELVVVAGFYRMVSGFLNTMGVELDEGVPGWPSGTGPA